MYINIKGKFPHPLTCTAALRFLAALTDFAFLILPRSDNCFLKTLSHIPSQKSGNENKIGEKS